MSHYGLFTPSIVKIEVRYFMGFPGGASGKEPACQWMRYKKHGFDPLVGKIPWRRTWQSTPVFLPGKSHGQKSLVGYGGEGCEESERTEVSQSTHKVLHISFWICHVLPTTEPVTGLMLETWSFLLVLFLEGWEYKRSS